MSFMRVNKKNLCPKCQKDSWCLIAENGTAVICQRIQEGSVKQINDAGFLHKLNDAYVSRQLSRRPKTKSEPAKDFFGLAKKYRKRLHSKLLEALSQKLGVSCESLSRMEVGWDGRNYAFPMRNGHDWIVGIRLRNDGGKFAVTGSKNGLFWPVDVEADSKNVLWICEGESDCSAMLDLGFDAIGRPSCMGGTSDIKTILRQRRREVVIMCDNDKPLKRQGGSVYFPGQAGADRLARELKPLIKGIKCIKPLHHKDIRAWVQAGATSAMVLATAKEAKYL